MGQLTRMRAMVSICSRALRGMCNMLPPRRPICQPTLLCRRQPEAMLLYITPYPLLSTWRRLWGAEGSGWRLCRLQPPEVSGPVSARSRDALGVGRKEGGGRVRGGVRRESLGMVVGQWVRGQGQKRRR